MSAFDSAADAADELPPIELAILSRQGGRDHNEDACGHWHSDSHLCCVVADGAGGHGGGDIASRTAVQFVIESYARHPFATPDEVEAQLRATNDEVIRHRADGEAQRNMYTTLVMLGIDFDQREAVWGHAGDSRLYLFRHGRQLLHSVDHSVVQGLVDAGLLAPEQMREHPRRSELYSALGTAPEDLRTSVSGTPHRLQAGDVFLLCTDGVWEHVDDAELGASLVQSPSATAWLAQIEQRVLANARSAGKTRHDNFSAVAIWIGHADPDIP
ncbi:MAG: serine/threonine-protein phosphatase [Pseudomonadota bacterium]|nr:serine/threonine-protein phosphatase [Pseudomonadota bacterium]